MKAAIPSDPPSDATFPLVDGPGRRRLRRWLLVVVVLGLGLGVAGNALFGQIISFRPTAIQEWLAAAGPWAPLIFIAAMIGAVVFSPIPSAPLSIAAGLSFGLVWGTVYTLVGAEAGAIIAFLIARWFGRPRLAGRLSPAAMRYIDELSDRVGARTILVMRLLPVFNFDLVSYAAGLTTIALPLFALVTLVGMTPPVIAIVAIGSNYADRSVPSFAILGVLVLSTVGSLLVGWYRRRPAGNRIPEDG